jgi:uncharacterized protein DUF4236
MGLRFRRRLRMMPGVSVNLSKSGVSASMGSRGTVVNVSGQGIRTTVGCRDPALAGRPHAGPGARRTGGEQAAARSSWRRLSSRLSWAR